MESASNLQAAAQTPQPLQKSSGELVRKANDVETERLSYKTINGGRALNVSVGLGFAIGR